MKVGDVVAPRPGNVFGPSEERKNGIIIDSYEDEYGIIYYEVYSRDR